MKKWIVSAAIVFGLSAVSAEVIPNGSVEAQAKSYNMSEKFAKNLRKGTLPRTSGKIGMTYKTLIKKEKGKAIIDGDPPVYRTKIGDDFLFNKFAKNKIPKDAKVKGIFRVYDYKISSKSVKKHFGKSYKAYNQSGKKVPIHVYKTGKYYTHIEVYKGKTYVDIGTKSTIKYVTSTGTWYK